MIFKRFKKAVCVLAAAAMMLCLSSCMAMENGLILNEDGTVRLYCSTTIEESTLTSMEMTKEDFLSSISESETSEEYEGFEVETVETEIDGKAHVGQRYYRDMTIEELNEYVQGVDGGIKAEYSAVEEGGKLLVTITYTNQNQASAEEASEMSEYISQGMMTTTQTITAPYEIVETNGTVDEETGKITWDIINVMAGTEAEAVLTVTYALPSSFPLAAVIVIAALVVIAIVVVVIVMLNKGNKTEIPVAPVDFSAPTQVENTAVQENQAQTETVQTEAVQTEAVQAEAPAEEEKEESAKPAFCEICGMKLNENDKFCPGCGEKI